MVALTSGGRVVTMKKSTLKIVAVHFMGVHSGKCHKIAERSEEVSHLNGVQGIDCSIQSAPTKRRL